MEQSWVLWAAGLAYTTLSAAMFWLSGKIEDVDKRSAAAVAASDHRASLDLAEFRKEQADRTKERREEITTLTNQLTASSQRAADAHERIQAKMGDMVTKTDLRDLEARLDLVISRITQRS